MQTVRPKSLELGLFLLLVALPLGFLPFTVSPFGDVKLVLLLGGALAVWLGAPPCDRRLRVAATAWVAVTFLASVLGVDPGVSLTASTSGESSGFMIVLASAALLVASPGIEAELLERARRWLVWVCLIVAGCGIAFRFAPELFVHVIRNDAFSGATLGNQLFAATFLVVGIAAILGGPRVGPRELALSGIIALGVASFGERSSLILPPLVCAVMVWRTRPPLVRGIAIFAVVLGALALWQVTEPLLAVTGQQSAVGQFGNTATDTQRVVVWKVVIRSAVERPALGWGPGTTQAAYLHEATPAEVAGTTRIWADAHDLFLETLVSSGVLGLLSLLAVVVLVVPRALRAAPNRAWPLGAAIGLAAYSMVEPVGIVLTPLLFLFAGIAAGPREDDIPPARAIRWVTPGALVVALVVSGSMLVASALQLWGNMQGEPWAYRASLHLAPWRTSTAEALALRLASDGHSNDPSIAETAAAQARSTIAAAIAAHPWDPNVRPAAIRVEVFLRDFAAAELWAAQQAELFPSDAHLLTDIQRAAGGEGQDTLPGS
ncbi:MAG: O-Antigen ligase [Actinomycetota bacterium]|jgi:O-antigen ligase|nr:O-Antigen ligase [Actinomycetota bacterium]